MNVAMVKPAASAESVGRRVSKYDWTTIASELNDFGCTRIETLMTPDECGAIAALYSEEQHFRSHIHMARHGFGKGEYRYFKYPLPDLIGGLRTALYPPLRAVANTWNERMGLARRYPQQHADSRAGMPSARPAAADAVAVAI